MTKWIRWSGLAGFSAILLLILAFWYFAAGPLIKLSIETFGSKALGAKLDVASVDLELNPVKLVLHKVEATDKKHPMKNLVSFERAEADLLFLPLLMGKTIIENVSVEGVAFDTDRQTSGALSHSNQVATTEPSSSDGSQAASTQDKDTSNKVNDLSERAVEALPTADELLAREPLLTVTRGEAMQASIEAHKLKIDQANQALPSKADLKSYEAEIKQLLSGKFKSLDDFKARKKAFDQLKAKFKADQATIKAAKQALSDANKDIRQQWPELQSAPGQDIRNIQRKYTLDAVGAQNLSALILGDKINGYLQQGLGYYDTLSPLLASDKKEADKVAEKEGRFVPFATDRPLPDFWIKSLSFSLKLAGGDVRVLVQDISQQPDVINKPIKLKASGNELTHMAAFNIDGVMDYRHQKVDNQFDLTIHKWQIQDLALGLEGLDLKAASLDITGQAKLDKTSILADAQGDFSQASFSSSASNGFAKEMSLALATIDTFNFSGDVTGKLKSPSMGIKSDLDKKLSRAFKQRLKQRQAKVEQDLKRKLNDKLALYAGDYKDEVKQLDFMETDLDSLSDKVSDLAKRELSSYQDQLKDEAKTKAKAELDKQKEDLKKKLKSLF
ncbi:hypothetical protein OA92_13445 [Marinomonas sp. SBI22]|uniref:TIGR03545 family protein n=1 Tax=unclassified Marinomonas TaxID=196814 RepID=UPI0007AF7890|nr:MULTISPECIES: TIGR03545 family protein [unclassified Marinomonas]KZM41415.1 hypothetical protein OA92_13445 [Marinomonas sp. SBI22]KZM43251.1 hypothetical protein OA91_11650 [Marinomonas sp. SBI8L]